MIQNIPTDPIAIEAQLSRRHGNDLAAVLLPTELAKRAAEDSRADAINVEINGIEVQLAELATRSAARTAVLQARMDIVDSARLKLGEEFQTEVIRSSQERSPLEARILELTQSYAGVLHRRQAELDLRKHAIAESLDTAMVAAVSKKEVLPSAPPLTGLALINSQVRPRRS